MIRLFELPGYCWPNLFDRSSVIDRSETSIKDYLASLGLEFVIQPSHADVFIRKAELSTFCPAEIQQEMFIQEKLKSRPCLNLIGEPRELAPVAYDLFSPTQTLAVAPGAEFERFFFGMPWRDPQLDDWKRRRDRFCWIGRPTKDRVALAKILLDQKLPLDIFSREAWPVHAWKGPASDDVETARAYRYRIVSENSQRYLYHSEKLFTGIQSGCVCFYLGDPDLQLPWLSDAFLRLNATTLQNREDLADAVIERMAQFVFTPDWEIYSVKQFIDRLAAQTFRLNSSPKISREAHI